MERPKPIKWAKLDNAAKIFPSSSGKRDTKVFRFSCEFYDLIDKDILQKALDETITQFPTFKSILRRGLFWYYFEETTKRPLVSEENKPPCSKMYFKSKKNLFFEVSYYKKRINFEVHHTLTDGTGAMNFLKTLVFNYTIIKYAEDFKKVIPVMEYDASLMQKEDDSFQRYYSNEKKEPYIKKVKIKRAFHMKGLRYPRNQIRIIEGIIPVKDILKEAHKYDATLSVFITSILIYSIGKELSILNRKKPIIVSIPVNLRQYFPSESVRNFFSVFEAEYNFTKSNGTFEDIIKTVKIDFESGLNKEYLKNRLNSLAALEHNYLTRMIPLFIKDYILKVASKISDAGMTATVSNIGKISMPKEFTKYINIFDIFISTDKLQICFCSYNNKLVIGFTSPYVNLEIQKNFFRMISGFGIDVELTVNPIE